MSGPGGGGPTPSPGEMPDCAKVNHKTSLASPDPDVVQGLSVGDILDMQLQDSDGPILVLDKGGQVAGSIVSNLTARLIHCMNDGFEYVAIVQKVDGGRCDVQIRSKGQR